MTASRLLILGALRQIQPAHGYQVRQELEAWEADTWANIAYGSIYHALNSMASEGLLDMHEAHDRKGGTTKKVYTLTSDGEKEYRHLLQEYWWEPKVSYDPFQIALAFRGDVPPAEMTRALEMRIRNARQALAHMQARHVHASPVMAANITLRMAQTEVFIAWAIEQVARAA
jgi:DNA-binding PadR family transcriptional regulator